MTEADRIKYLRIVLLVVGLIFILAYGPSRFSGLLAGLGTRRSLGISRDDFRYLCHARRVLDYCLARSNGAPKPYLVHRLVEYRAWGDHGGSVHRQPSHIGHLWGDVLALIIVGAYWQL